jgi:hypothetical protein
MHVFRYVLVYSFVVCVAVLNSSNCTLGRAIAQAVSRWLPTAAARVRARFWSCGICDGQSGAGAGFLRVLQFPLPIFIPPIAPQSSSSIIWGLYNRPVVAAVPSGLSPTPPMIKNCTLEMNTLKCEYWYIMAYTPVSKQRPRNKQQNNVCC